MAEYRYDAYEFPIWNIRGDYYTFKETYYPPKGAKKMELKDYSTAQLKAELERRELLEKVKKADVLCDHTHVHFSSDIASTAKKYGYKYFAYANVVCDSVTGLSLPVAYSELK